MADASWPLQKAIFDVLDATLSVPVFDSPPPNPAFPYVAIGEDTSVDDSSKVDSTQDFSINIHIWSRERGRWQVKQLIDEIDEALHDQPLPMTGGYVAASMWRESSQTMVDPDGLTTHGVISFRARINAD